MQGRRGTPTETFVLPIYLGGRGVTNPEAGVETFLHWAREKSPGSLN
jgi:hypothetical protein